MANHTDKSLEQWLWDAARSIRGAKDAPKYKDYIRPPFPEAERKLFVCASIQSKI